MVTWTCPKCGFTGVYNAMEGRSVYCRNCRTATVATRKFGVLRTSSSEQTESKTVIRWRIHFAMLFLFIAGILGLISWKGGYLNKARETFPGDTTAISGIEDPRIGRSVGLLVVGVYAVLPDGKIVEKPTATGTCFMITPQGHALTNKHVVEEAINFSRSPRKEEFEHDRKVRLTAKYWTFFEDKQREADVIYADENQDLAILQVHLEDDEEVPFFALAENTDFPRGMSVYALGFPGAARTPLSKDELLEQVLKESVSTRIRQYFKSRDFVYVQTRGFISRVFRENGRIWLEHDALIHAGSSGGPLITGMGYVLGMNTGKASENLQLNYALVLGETRKLIEPLAESSVWSKLASE